VKREGGSNETSPPEAISASGCGRCRAAGPVVHGAGARLSDAAGARDRAVCAPVASILLDERLEAENLLILLGERSLRRALSEYVEHFHAERNHQGKGNILLFPRGTNIRRDGSVQCCEFEKAIGEAREQLEKIDPTVRDAQRPAIQAQDPFLRLANNFPEAAKRPPWQRRR
jgi:hypothetical protein